MGLAPDEATTRLSAWAGSDAAACASLEALPAGRGVFGVEDPRITRLNVTASAG